MSSNESSHFIWYRKQDDVRLHRTLDLSVTQTLVPVEGCYITIVY